MEKPTSCAWFCAERDAVVWHGTCSAYRMMQTVADSFSQQGARAAIPTLNALRANASARSHVGKVRRKNEDQFLIGDISSAIRVRESSIASPEPHFGSAPHTFLVVADGMGGHPAGDRAATLAVSALESFILRALGHIGTLGFRDAGELLRAGFQVADGTVVEASRDRTSLNGMGTTMTAALVGGSEAYIAHAGDSRAYLHRDRALRQLTRDHTMGEAIRRRAPANGSVAPNAYEAMDHIVTNAVGGGTAGVSPDILRVDLRAGDRLLLCSDGLTKMVKHVDIEDILLKSEEPSDVCRLLVESALEHGGKDNITVLVARFDPE